MSPPAQYALLLGLAVGSLGLALSLYGIARSLGKPRARRRAKTCPRRQANSVGTRCGRASTSATTGTPCCSWPSTWRWPTCTRGPSSARSYSNAKADASADASADARAEAALPGARQARSSFLRRLAARAEARDFRARSSCPVPRWRVPAGSTSASLLRSSSLWPAGPVAQRRDPLPFLPLGLLRPARGQNRRSANARRKKTSISYSS
jgi:hypothetical protein